MVLVHILRIKCYKNEMVMLVHRVILVEIIETNTFWSCMNVSVNCLAKKVIDKCMGRLKLHYLYTHK
jgi:hypothetical protein